MEPKVGVRAARTHAERLFSQLEREQVAHCLLRFHRRALGVGGGLGGLGLGDRLGGHVGQQTRLLWGSFWTRLELNPRAYLQWSYLSLEETTGWQVDWAAHCQRTFQPGY